VKTRARVLAQDCRFCALAALSLPAEEALWESETLRKKAEESEERDVLEKRRGVREERSRKIVERIRDWAYAQRPLPQSELGKAIA
jgi:hypothetical protein